MNVISKTEMNVKGVKRTVHLGEYNDNLDGFPARTYVNSKSVAGVVRQNIVGVRRFYPKGKNADLV